MAKPWFMFSTDDEHLFDAQGFIVPFGNPNYDAEYGGAHDLDVNPPPNHPVTALLPGRIVDLSEPPWGKQVGIELDQPYKPDVRYMAFLHLSAINPDLRMHQHVEKGDSIGWVGGANDPRQYGDTTNPTGENFTNHPSESSQIQVGVALMRVEQYGITDFNKWIPKGSKPIEWELDPSQIIYDARKAFLEGDDMLQITNEFAKTHFERIDENRWHCRPTNHDVIGGILKFYRRTGGAPRLPLTDERRDIPGVVYQVFEAGIIAWDVDGSFDHVSGFSDGCYMIKFEDARAHHMLSQLGLA